MPPATGVSATPSSEILAGVDVEASVLRADGEGGVAFEKKLVVLIQRALQVSVREGLQDERLSSPAAMEHSGIAVRWSALLDSILPPTPFSN